MNDFIYKLKNLHWTLIFLVFFLSLVGLVMIFSATKEEGLTATTSQLMKLLLGFSIMFAVAITNINFWQKYSFLLYIIGISFLVYATFYGFIGKGSRRWINLLGINIQPSEIMKIFLILALAKFFDERKMENFKEYFFLLIPIFLIILPFSIIITQPDLGTSVVLLSLGIVVFFFFGINFGFFIFCFLIFFILSALLLLFFSYFML